MSHLCSLFTLQPLKLQYNSDICVIVSYYLADFTPKPNLPYTVDSYLCSNSTTYLY